MLRSPPTDKLQLFNPAIEFYQQNRTTHRILRAATADEGISSFSSSGFLFQCNLFTHFICCVLYKRDRCYIAHGFSNKGSQHPRGGKLIGVVAESFENFITQFGVLLADRCGYSGTEISRFWQKQPGKENSCLSNIFYFGLLIYRFFFLIFKKMDFKNSFKFIN